MRELNPKISIIGCGNVGMRYAYALMIKGLARQIVLVDIDQKRLEGEALDLSHGAPFISPTNIIAGDYNDIKDSEIIVITAGKKQKPGQSRLDVVKENVALFRDIIPKITKYVPNAIFLIASNPVDILSYATYKFSKKDPMKVIGSGTVLDTSRLRYNIAKRCNIDPRNIHAYILGEHGDTEVPIWSKAMLGGLKMDEYCFVCKHSENCIRERELQVIFEDVRDSAYKIIESKGETSYGIGLSLVRITQAVVKDENSILTVSCLLDDYLGISDVYLSIPVIINKDGVRDVLELDLNKYELDKLNFSANTLKTVIKDLDL